MATKPPSPAQNSAPAGAPAAKAPDEPPPIWFFVGALLLLYGLIILGAGIYQFSHLPHTVLAKDHASFWGGLGLTIFGAAFTWGFWPRRKGKETGKEASGS
ncbi:MAG: hypothetical protein ACRD2E_07440 [Terriglobales bacterium]